MTLPAFVACAWFVSFMYLEISGFLFISIRTKIFNLKNFDMYLWYLQICFDISMATISTK